MMMTRSWWRLGLATVAASLAAACGHDHVTAPPADGAPGATGNAGGAGARNTAGATGNAGEAGQTTAADCGAIAEPSSWASWVMPNPVQSQLPNPASYTVSDDGNQVIDRVTGLAWQRNVDPRAMTWDVAQHYCGCLTLDGESDWRLPSRIELASLVDWTAASPAIDAVAFPSTTSENFWTSSVVTIDPGLVYLIFFLNGHTTYAALDYEYRTRCVRSSTPPIADHYTEANGTVHDIQTTLTWQQAFPALRYAWADATAYCAGLSLDGAGWRLPSINELQTLVDDSVNPSIDAKAFPITPSEYFWSSSAVVDDASRAWTTFFTNGSTYSFVVTTAKNVRCVR